MFEYFLQALTPINLMLAVVGVVAGVTIGGMPGLTATMAVAVLTPLTFTMPADSALIALAAIYMGAIYGGCYAAILANTPGTPSSIATTFDGYPMAKRGDGQMALSLATIASVTGGFLSVMALLLLAPPLAKVALAFGPPEYFWLAVLGLTLVASLSKGTLMKGLLGACLGLLISFTGSAVIGGDMRFTFNQPALVGGVDIIVALIGIFCIPVILDLVSSPDPHLEVNTGTKKGLRLGEAFGHVWREKVNLLKSSGIGTLVGALPAAGGSVASLLAYSEARRSARNSDEYGKGAPGGIIASEAANNGTVGGGFIPTLVLGIPGTPPDAIILGALLVHGIRIGPDLFTEHSAVVYTFIFGLAIATLIMLPIGLFMGRYAFKAFVAIPKTLLVPGILLMTVLGTYAIHSSYADVVMMLALGVIAWILSRAGFAPAPIVLGVVLGAIAEQGFVQAWLIGSAEDNLLGMYFGRPISLLIIGLIVLGLFYPLIMKRFKKKLMVIDNE
ncbi:MAG TPA: tripartite tricarboxylate transporter permease [Thioalkalivibrio sp.]|nr:tripartite tricarboxylate transporter permease [Thioalkalivibrio sp.]